MGGKMSFWQSAFKNSQLSKPTSIFGLKLFVVIGIFIGASFVLLLFLLSFCFSSLRPRRRRHLQLSLPSPLPSSRKPLKLLLHDSTSEISKEILPISPKAPIFKEQYQLPLPLPPPPPTTIVEVTHLGWGHWYTLKELEVATNHFADENVIGEGGYGIVYRGALRDGSIVAVKNLMNNRGQAEKEFKVEVEAIGKVRHKNLVRLMGYCVEGAHSEILPVVDFVLAIAYSLFVDRMLVYEYVDNGNLDQWLHGDVGEVSPLTWDIRMNILLSTAKGLAYLHEGLEPKVVHRDVKSSNILLDRQWNAKVSDFGLAKLICSERTYVTTRVMGTFGYVAPEYASTGMLNERSDVYSFGVLIMEVISGRAPVDYSKPLGEVNLVEWSKCMVGERKSEQVVDPKMREKPSPKALKRMLLVALRCLDPDALKRPKMGHVIHMLEVEDLLFREDCKPGREPAGKLDRYNPSEEGSFGRNNHQSRWR